MNYMEWENFEKNYPVKFCYDSKTFKDSLKATLINNYRNYAPHNFIEDASYNPPPYDFSDNHSYYYIVEVVI